MKHFRDDKPIYLQIKEELEEAIISQRLAEGAGVMSIRALSTHYKVNPNTISNAFAELESSGIIFKKRGIGFFVQDGAREKLLELKKRVFLEKFLEEVVEKAKIVNINLEEILIEITKRYNKGEKWS
ncbi:MAG: hypothetical protein B6226_01045 [Candidatus Cloacimonetes bacterium 4572_65]|nr:MAG: hypothetical protein B6226_01045 [Candidatus Cloacimonetes bacterium 4572_65]